MRNFFAHQYLYPWPRIRPGNGGKRGLFIRGENAFPVGGAYSDGP